MFLILQIVVGILAILFVDWWVTKKEPQSGLFITTRGTPRTSINCLPYGYRITCTRAHGWELWYVNDSCEILLAAEFGPDWLVLDIDGQIVLDNRDEFGEVNHAASITRKVK